LSRHFITSDKEYQGYLKLSNPRPYDNILKDKGVQFVYDKLVSINSNEKELRKEHIAEVRKKKYSR